MGDVISVSTTRITMGTIVAQTVSMTAPDVATVNVWAVGTSPRFLANGSAVPESRTTCAGMKTLG